jgi:hypothetical protein
MPARFPSVAPFLRLFSLSPAEVHPALRRMRKRPLAPAVAFLALFTGCNDTGDDKSTTAPLGDCTPSGDEVCDGLDNDCDGEIDEGVGTVFYADADGDGFGGRTESVACERPEGFVDDSTDCDDLDPAAHPGADEVCDDIDNDCDGAIDQDDPDVDLSTVSTYYIDEDGDGYGTDASSTEACSTPEGHADNADDCDDTDALIHPETRWYPDADDDSYGDEAAVTVGCEAPDDHILEGGDCDDLAPEVNPEALERCDGVDNNCDGAVDEDSAVDASTWYADGDGDGVGIDGDTVTACDPPEGYAATAGDCDDAEPANFPGNVERCDGIDNDCDGGADLDWAVPGDFSTIQEAVDAAGTGDGICVGSGTFTESLLFDSTSLTLAGQADGTTVLDAGGDRAFDSQNGAFITVQDLELRDVDGSRGAAFRATGGQVTVRDVDVRLSSVRSSSVDGLFALTDGTLRLEGVTVRSTSLTSTFGDVEGALVHATDAAVVLEDVLVEGTTVESEGAFTGLVHLTDSTLSSTGLQLLDSTVDARGHVVGGLLFALASDVVLDHTAAARNSLSSSGLDLSNGYWLRLEGDAGANTALLRWLVIDDNALVAADDAWSAIHVNSTEQVELTNILYTRNTTRVADDGYGVLYAYDSDVALTNADLAANDWLGFDTLHGLVGYRAYGADIALLNVNVADNSSDAAPAATLLSAAYANAEGYGSFSMDHSNAHGNTVGDNTWLDGAGEGNTSAFVGNVSIDPAYTDPGSGDFTLSATSPVIDLGDPALLDADGSASDIGAFGGPDGAGWELLP